MAGRANEVNNGGIVTVSGSNMPANFFTNAQPQISRATGQGNTVATPTVTANGHAVEEGGDGGCWDTVSNINVLRDRTNIDAINL